jgi:hypothetical protein
VSRFHVLHGRTSFRRYRGRRSRFHVLRSRTHFRRFRERRVPFSSFALPDTFLALPRASVYVFLFCAAGLIFGVTEGVLSRFYVLRSRTRFRRFRGCRVPFSCFARPYSFSTEPRASGPVFMFCASELVFDESEDVGSRFNVLRSRTRFGQYRSRQVPFSCFALPDSFSAVPRATGIVFLFYALELIFDSTGNVWSRFHVLRSKTRFRQFRGRRVPFSCIALPDTFSAVPRASGPIFMFCAPVLVFGGIEGVGSLFMFCCPVLVFGGAEGVGSRFLVLRSRTHFGRYRGRWYRGR